MELNVASTEDLEKLQTQVHALMRFLKLRFESCYHEEQEEEFAKRGDPILKWSLCDRCGSRLRDRGLVVLPDPEGLGPGPY